MTKIQMTSEILNCTRLSNVKREGIEKAVKRRSLEYVVKVYEAFKEDTEHALYYASLLVMP